MFAVNGRCVDVGDLTAIVAVLVGAGCSFPSLPRRHNTFSHHHFSTSVLFLLELNYFIVLCL